MEIMKRVSEQFKGVTFALFDDVLSTLSALKQQDLIPDLLINLAGDVVTSCRKLGLEPYLNFVVTAE